MRLHDNIIGGIGSAWSTSRLTLQVYPGWTGLAVKYSTDTYPRCTLGGSSLAFGTGTAPMVVSLDYAGGSTLSANCGQFNVGGGLLASGTMTALGGVTCSAGSTSASPYVAVWEADPSTSYYPVKRVTLAQLKTNFGLPVFAGPPSITPEKYFTWWEYPNQLSYTAQLWTDGSGKVTVGQPGSPLGLGVYGDVYATTDVYSRGSLLITHAAADGQYWASRNGTWQAFTPGGGGLGEPSTDFPHFRSIGAWDRFYVVVYPDGTGGGSYTYSPSTVVLAGSSSIHLEPSLGGSGELVVEISVTP